MKKEKVIIAGASTVVQMAGRRTIKQNENKYANIAYYRDYGYHVRVTDEWLKNYYGYLKYYGTNDTDADLFFICHSGAGYRWLTGNYPANYYATAGTPGEGKEKINRIISNNPNCHFTIGVLLLGNDLSSVKPTETSKINGIADKYAAYYKNLASEFPSHDIYALTPTPCTKGKGMSDSNVTNTNKKRSIAITRLQQQLSGSNVKFINLYSKFKNDVEYETIDGKHYNKNTAKKVFGQILSSMNVLSGVGKKK